MSATSQSTADLAKRLRQEGEIGFLADSQGKHPNAPGHLFIACADALEAYALETLEQSATIEELEGRAGMDAAALRCYAAREKALLELALAPWLTVIEHEATWDYEEVEVLTASEVLAILESKP